MHIDAYASPSFTEFKTGQNESYWKNKYLFFGNIIFGHTTTSDKQGLLAFFQSIIFIGTKQTFCSGVNGLKSHADGAHHENLTAPLDPISPAPPSLPSAWTSTVQCIVIINQMSEAFLPCGRTYLMTYIWDCSTSNALAMEILQSCTNPSIPHRITKASTKEIISKLT